MIAFASTVYSLLEQLELNMHTREHDFRYHQEHYGSYTRLRKAQNNRTVDLNRGESKC